MVSRRLGVISASVEHESVKRALRNTSPSSLMSDTKWRKLFSALTGVPSVDHYFLKLIRGEEEEAGYGRFDQWPPHAFVDTANFGPLYLADIEWIEFPSIVPKRKYGSTPPGGHYQDVQGLRRALDSIGKFPIEETPRGLRIIGHVLGARRDTKLKRLGQIAEQ